MLMAHGGPDDKLKKDQKGCIKEMGANNTRHKTFGFARVARLLPPATGEKRENCED